MNSPIPLDVTGGRGGSTPRASVARPRSPATGCHIGYDIRPSARGRGHATALLGAALGLANSLGVERALLTCAPDNLASRRVIELNGGVLSDVSPVGRLR